MPARFAPVLFGFILSGLMSLLVSGIATFRNAGLSAVGRRRVRLGEMAACTHRGVLRCFMAGGERDRPPGAGRHSQYQYVRTRVRARRSTSGVMRTGLQRSPSRTPTSSHSNASLETASRDFLTRPQQKLRPGFTLRFRLPMGMKASTSSALRST